MLVYRKHDVLLTQHETKNKTHTSIFSRIIERTACFVVTSLAAAHVRIAVQTRLTYPNQIDIRYGIRYVFMLDGNA